jgi:ParB-like chromosome segregation protein Spo0J
MLTIQYKKIDELIPYARNSRTHSDAQVAQIAGSIKEFGWRVPVLIDGENGIIAGHGRVLAAYKLGITDIPTIDGSDMTEIQKRLYVIADNKIALNAGWDEEILMMEIKDLQDMGADIELLAFDPSELNIKNIDYSLLDDENVEQQLNDMADGVRKAIQIEFEPEHYDEAFELVKFWRKQDLYIGQFLINKLKEEKEKL